MPIETEELRWTILLQWLVWRKRFHTSREILKFVNGELQILDGIARYKAFLSTNFNRRQQALSYVSKVVVSMFLIKIAASQDTLEVIIAIEWVSEWCLDQKVAFY